MIFALGFLVATLLALLVLPAVSRRAVRLATARLRLLVPLSMTEIVAERDQIRAGHAVAVRRLEQRIEQLDRDKAGLMAETGRQGTRLGDLALAHERLVAAHDAQGAELDRALRDAREAAAEAGLQAQGLHDALGLAERRLALLHATEAQRVAAEILTDEQRASLAALETRGTGQDLRIRDLAAQLARAAEDLRAQRAAADALGRDRDERLAEAAALRARLDEEQARRGALEAERDRFAETVDRLERQAVAAATARAAVDDDLAVLRRTIVALGADLLQVAEAAGPDGPMAACRPPGTDPAEAPARPPAEGAQSLPNVSSNA